MFKKIHHVIIYLILFLLSLFLIKGKDRNFLFNTNTTEGFDTSLGSPFESSGSRSRYALTESIVENKSIFFNENQARFAAPDVINYNNKYFSVFTPGVSFIGIPFYILGRLIAKQQILTFLSNILLALINVYLISKLTKKIGVGQYFSFLSGYIFLFCTNALSYTSSYTQHHATTTAVLLALLNFFSVRSLKNNILFGFLFGLGLLLDIPNILIFIPIFLAVIFKHFQILKLSKGLTINLKLKALCLFLGFLPILIIFGWYNYKLTQSPLKIGQMFSRTNEFDSQELKIIEEQNIENKKSYRPGIPFLTRKQLNGLYILLLSNERGWLFYSPVLIFGFLGIYYLYQNNKFRNISLVLFTSVLINILVYSMFGDVWGGWAFGPRYLIPANALLCIPLGLTIQKYKKHTIFIVLFSILIIYSLGVNILGAFTTTQVPPKIEAINLVTPIPYTYKYNLQLIKQNITSSLFYNLFLTNKISVQAFVIIYFCIILSIITSLYVLSYSKKDDQITKT